MNGKFSALFISGLVIGIYCLTAVIKGIFGTTEWFGSPMSVLLSILLLVIWIIVAAAYVVFLLRDTYCDLDDKEKKIVNTFLGKVVHEAVKELGQRKDKVGRTARFVSKVL